MTTGEISAHFADVYGASVSRDTVSRITDRVIEEMQAWSGRPLEAVYAAIFIDAIMVKIRASQSHSQGRPCVNDDRAAVSSSRVSAPAIRTHIRSGHQSYWSRSALATCGQMRA